MPPGPVHKKEKAPNAIGSRLFGHGCLAIDSRGGEMPIPPCSAHENAVPPLAIQSGKPESNRPYTSRGTQWKTPAFLPADYGIVLVRVHVGKGHEMGSIRIIATVLVVIGQASGSVVDAAALFAELAKLVIPARCRSIPGQFCSSVVRNQIHLHFRDIRCPVKTQVLARCKCDVHSFFLC